MLIRLLTHPLTKVTTDFIVELGEKYYFCSFRIQIKNVPVP